MKVPGPEKQVVNTLLTDATAVAAEWYKPIGPAPVAWRKWLNVATVELWEAIAISCGIEPAYNPQGTDPGFDERMAIAKSHLRPGGKLQAVAIDKRLDCSVVRLADVATLAASCSPPWGLPKEFPSPFAAPDPAEKAAVPSEPPSERRERLTRRRDELKAKGVRGFLKTIAAEESVSVQRIKQILSSGDQEQTSPHWMTGIPPKS